MQVMRAGLDAASGVFPSWQAPYASIPTAGNECTQDGVTTTRPSSRKTSTARRAVPMLTRYSALHNRGVVGV